MNLSTILFKSENYFAFSKDSLCLFQRGSSVISKLLEWVGQASDNPTYTSVILLELVLVVYFFAKLLSF